MKLLFWLLAGVFLLQLATPAESRADPEYEIALRLERGIKKWFKDAWDNITKTVKKWADNLSAFASKLKPKVDQLMKDGEKYAKQAKKVLDSKKKSFDKKFKEKVTKFAYSIQKGDEFTEDAKAEIEKQVKAMIKTEEDISKELLKCAKQVKPEAEQLKKDHKELFGKCRSDSLKALAQAARIVLNSIIESVPEMKEGLAKVATAYSEDDWVEVAKGLWTSCSKAYKTFKKNWSENSDKVKGPLEKASACIVDAHKKATADWEKLSNKANCN